jgi:hypothetical protein
MPLQGPFGMANERVELAEKDGGPKPAGLVLSRVSTSRQGGMDTKRSPAVDGDTVMLPLVPEMLGDNKSLTVIVVVPAVTSDAENVPTPLVSAESGGNAALGSVLVKCTGLVYVVATPLLLSSAVTVN